MNDEGGEENEGTEETSVIQQQTETQDPLVLDAQRHEVKISFGQALPDQPCSVDPPLDVRHLGSLDNEHALQTFGTSHHTNSVPSLHLAKDPSAEPDAANGSLDMGECYARMENSQLLQMS